MLRHRLADRRHLEAGLQPVTAQPIDPAASGDVLRSGRGKDTGAQFDVEAVVGGGEVSLTDLDLAGGLSEHELNVPVATVPQVAGLGVHRLAVG